MLIHILGVICLVVSGANGMCFYLKPIVNDRLSINLLWFIANLGIGCMIIGGYLK